MVKYICVAHPPRHMGTRKISPKKSQIKLPTEETAAEKNSGNCL